MTDPKALLHAIHAKVPLIPGERAHQWEAAMMRGCALCRGHRGWVCRSCQRCVDRQLDLPLYLLIEEIMNA